MLEQTGFLFFILLVFFICVSKAAVNIAGGVLLLVSLIYVIRYIQKDCVFINRDTVILLIPLAIGLFLSLFSLSGPKGAVAFLERYRFFLLVFPFALFVNSEKKINVLGVVLNLSALAGLIYGYAHSNNKLDWGVFNGFHAIGRNSDLMISISLMNLVILLGYQWETKRRNIGFKSMISVNTLFMLIAVLIMGRRGSYLGFMIGLVVVLATFRKKMLFVLLAVVVCSSLYFSNSWVTQRAISIIDLTDNISNTIRLQLNRTGVDYLIEDRLFLRGTGGKMAEKPFGAFFNSKPPEYQAKYDTVKQYLGNFHNSFLQIAVEAGLFFLLIYLLSIGYMLVAMVKRLPHLMNNRKVYPIAALVVTVGFYVSQFFHNDLYSYGGIPYVLIFSGGCYMVKQSRPYEGSSDLGGDAASSSI